jgi:hypothetical protein
MLKKVTQGLIKHHAIKRYAEVEVQVSGELHAPCCFASRETAPGTYCIRVWMGLRSGLDFVEEITISCTYW